MIGGLSAINGPSAGAVYFGLRGPPPTVVGSGAVPLFSGFFSCLSFPLSFFFLRSRTAGRTGMLPSSINPTFFPRSLSFSSSSAGSAGSAWSSASSAGASGSASSVASSSVAGSVSSVEVSSEESSAASASCGAASSTGAVMITGSAAACGSSAGASGSGLPAICSSRYSAVILSSVLEATFALAIPSSLAFARTSLLGIPIFLAIS